MESTQSRRGVEKSKQNSPDSLDKRNPNPDNLPQFLDYYFVREENGWLSIRHAPFLRETEAEIRLEFEKEEGFVRWLTQGDIDTINNQFRNMVVEHFEKEEKRETAGNS